MAKTHNVKIQHKYFTDIVSGIKPFEYRLNDRNYQVGDIVNLQEWNPIEYYTGNKVKLVITYIYRIPDSQYCIFSFIKINVEVK